MTDSMKFGPEWLRNMSADTTNPSLGTGGGSSVSSNTNSSTTVSASGSHHNNSNILGHTPAPRNLFPEFRYGREEMLSLFDKNCNLPEILPSYKKIFIEKVQYPLALMPSSEDEIMTQGPAVPTQRPAWLQRSPVGISSTTRGIGRGGSVDRGRMRGKSAYHPIYQRPTAIFEDEARPTLKPERGWSERNGAGEPLASGGGGVGLGSDWNGTPTSPRKEFSSHPRNLENWRRNRNEDGSGDPPSTGITNTEGWRSFGSTNRWGRSTSWRDDDISTANPDSGYAGSGVTMQRSYSTISTTSSERGGYSSSSLSKSSQNTTNYSGGHHLACRASNSISGTSSQSARSGQWASNSTCMAGANGGGDGEDNLPEWAMENPSDGGGTFDASGAFHRSVDEDNVEVNKEQRKLESSETFNEDESATRFNEKTENDEETLPEKEKAISLCSENSVASASDSNENSDLNNEFSISNDMNTDLPSISQLESQFQSQTKHLREYNTSKVHHITVPDDTNLQTLPIPVSSSLIDSTLFNTNTALQNQKYVPSQADYSDRMKEVADDMVEKLIMDDDSLGANDCKASNDVKLKNTSEVTTAIGVRDAFVSPAVAAIFNQNVPHQAVRNIASESPALPSITGEQKAIPLYGGACVVDHATMQQHQQQQQQLLAAAAAAATLPQVVNSAASPDLWFYRDPQSKVQGPFTAIEMTEWYRAGYFNENLYVRRVCDTRFRALGELIKVCHGNMPFTHSHLIPMGLENIHITNSPVISQMHEKPQVLNDFHLKQQTDQREELKGNVTAAADSLSSAVKNLISSVDMSQMLNMHFQMLQEQYIRQQEINILTELSKSDCFQRLTPHERETVVRQKVQMLGLPEYLTSLSGLSNSLATLNPTAGNQLFDAIAECSKKDHNFSGGVHQHQQPTAMNTFLEASDFDLNGQRQHPQPHSPFTGNYSSVLGSGSDNSASSKTARGTDDSFANELLRDYNMRMFFRNGNSTSQQKSQDFMGGVNSTNFLSEQQLMAAAPSQAPVLQMWMPQLGGSASTLQHPQVMTHQQQPPLQGNQWGGGPLVGIPSAVIAGTQGGSSNIVQPKFIPTSMWDVPLLEQGKNQQVLDHNLVNFDEKQAPNLLQYVQPKEHQQLQIQERKEIEISTELHPQMLSPSQQQMDAHSGPSINPQISTMASKQRKDEQMEKPQNSTKRNNSKQQLSVAKPKEDNANKKADEDRRREAAEEKRRQKEERKRLQVEEEKRRMQQIEEQRRRQTLEEKERQQQIHAQRRKAMLGNSCNTTTTISPCTVGAPDTKSSKDQQRIQSSIAPWSAQNNAATNRGGPCLAEIQKAEQRERRADQQRQMEMLEKQLRANAAAADANDLLLTWHAPPVPVKSFAEIQAEEAKRLASEQLELQRRKETRQQATSVSPGITSANASNSASSSGNLSTIWSGSKVWGSTNATGFWEESRSNANSQNNSNITAAAIVAAGLASNNAKQSQALLQKLPGTASSQPSRNLKKSQTVSIMQNSPSAVKNTKNNQQLQCNATIAKEVSKGQQNKGDAEKKANTKSQNNNTTAAVTYAAAANKVDDLENEFFTWCMKSISHMNSNIDVPTFVAFLQNLESPYEVKDYIRVYLGETKEYTDFAKQFLERRSKYKNLQRAQNAHNDDMCKPAPAITPLGNDSSDSKSKQRKVKKSKMTKLDARILGFSVTAAEGRINVGDRDYVDGP